MTKVPEAIAAVEVKPRTKKVHVGKDIITGEDVHVDVNIVEPNLYATDDRLEYTVHTDLVGSINGRKLNLVRGDKVNFSALEFKHFKGYVSK